MIDGMVNIVVARKTKPKNRIEGATLLVNNTFMFCFKVLRTMFTGICNMHYLQFFSVALPYSASL